MRRALRRIRQRDAAALLWHARHRYALYGRRVAHNVEGVARAAFACQTRGVGFAWIRAGALRAVRSRYEDTTVGVRRGILAGWIARADSALHAAVLVETKAVIQRRYASAAQALALRHTYTRVLGDRRRRCTWQMVGARAASCEVVAIARRVVWRANAAIATYLW